MPPSSCIKKSLLTAVSENHWIWIAVLYGLQAVGSLVVIPLLKLTFKEMIFPLLLLFIGTMVSMAMALRNRKCSVGRWECWIPPIIYALFIFSLSHRSFHGTAMPFSTNYFHPFEYATLGIFLCCVWRPVLERRGSTVFSFAVIFTGLIYAITDETHQSFIPGRYPSLLDLLLDALGLTVGCGFFLFARYIGRRALNDRQELIEKVCSGE